MSSSEWFTADMMMMVKRPEYLMLFAAECLHTLLRKRFLMDRQTSPNVPKPFEVWEPEYDIFICKIMMMSHLTFPSTTNPNCHFRRRERIWLPKAKLGYRVPRHAVQTTRGVVRVRGHRADFFLNLNETQSSRVRIALRRLKNKIVDIVVRVVY